MFKNAREEWYYNMVPNSSEVKNLTKCQESLFEGNDENTITKPNYSNAYFASYEIIVNTFKNKTDNYKFTWCSGECINSPGQGTTSGIKVN